MDEFMCGNIYDMLSNPSIVKMWEGGRESCHIRFLSREYLWHLFYGWRPILSERGGDVQHQTTSTNQRNQPSPTENVHFHIYSFFWRVSCWPPRTCSLNGWHATLASCSNASTSSTACWREARRQGHAPQASTGERGVKALLLPRRTRPSPGPHRRTVWKAYMGKSNAFRHLQRAL